MSTSTNSESVEQEMTPEERCQALMDSVTDMRVRYPAHIAKLDEKIVKINIALLKKRLNSHRNLKIRTPKYTMDVNLNLENLEKLKEPFKLQREKIRKLETLRKMANQLKNDRIGVILSEDINSKTIMKRVQKKMAENQEESESDH